MAGRSGEIWSRGGNWTHGNPCSLCGWWHSAATHQGTTKRREKHTLPWCHFAVICFSQDLYFRGRCINKFLPRPKSYLLFKAILTKVSRSICLSGYSSTLPFPFLRRRLEPFSFLSIVFNLSRLLLSLSKCTTELDPPTSSGGLLLCPSFEQNWKLFQ